jgi:hypothetical protein
VWVDAVEKVTGMPPARNNRIMGTEFLNRSCAFDARLESMLLGDPPQNPFSTASVTSSKARREHIVRCSSNSGRNREGAVRQFSATCGLVHRSKRRARIAIDLLDHLVGTGEQQRWNVEAERDAPR